MRAVHLRHAEVDGEVKMVAAAGSFDMRRKWAVKSSSSLYNDHAET